MQLLDARHVSALVWAPAAALWTWHRWTGRAGQTTRGQRLKAVTRRKSLAVSPSVLTATRSPDDRLIARLRRSVGRRRPLWNVASWLASCLQMHESFGRRRPMTREIVTWRMNDRLLERIFRRLLMLQPGNAAIMVRHPLNSDVTSMYRMAE